MLFGIAVLFVVFLAYEIYGAGSTVSPMLAIDSAFISTLIWAGAFYLVWGTYKGIRKLWQRFRSG